MAHSLREMLIPAESGRMHFVVEILWGMLRYYFLSSSLEFISVTFALYASTAAW
jgi:hypothetical protein